MQIALQTYMILATQFPVTLDTHLVNELL